jgi:hypothetical protein
MPNPLPSLHNVTSTMTPEVLRTWRQLDAATLRHQTHKASLRKGTASLPKGKASLPKGTTDAS